MDLSWSGLIMVCVSRFFIGRMASNLLARETDKFVKVAS